jgi:hypothetical protein
MEVLLAIVATFILQVVFCLFCFVKHRAIEAH